MVHGVKSLNIRNKHENLVTFSCAKVNEDPSPIEVYTIGNGNIPFVMDIPPFTYATTCTIAPHMFTVSLCINDNCECTCVPCGAGDCDPGDSCAANENCDQLIADSFL